MNLKNIPNFFTRIFYGWRMIGLVSAIRIVGGGLHQFGFTVFFLPISQDLGIGRAATSLAFSLSRAQGAVEAPLVGYLIDRYGPRPTLITAVFSCRRWLHPAVLGEWLFELHDCLPGRDLSCVRGRICPLANGCRQQ